MLLPGSARVTPGFRVALVTPGLRQAACRGWNSTAGADGQDLFSHSPRGTIPLVTTTLPLQVLLVS